MKHVEDLFVSRHIGSRQGDVGEMLHVLGCRSLQELVDKALPSSIRYQGELALPEPLSEEAALKEITAIMAENRLHKSFIGQGYHGTFVPPVILRNFLENPAWYTSYTPYQAEISQGRLELLFHFQTLIAELTGLPIAAASLLDEGTALAEAASMAVRYFSGKRDKIVLAGEIHPQDLKVLQTRARSQKYELVEAAAQLSEQVAALIIPCPDTYGVFHDYTQQIEQMKALGGLVIVAADPLGLLLHQSPAELGADIAVGSMQRFGVPMGFGGPYAGYLAASAALTRLMPGRIVGQSKDTKGRVAYRSALQTREQHIRRDRATSNICTAQALLANMSAAFAIWHGKQGLISMAERVHALACRFAAAVKEAGVALQGERFFDCVTLITPRQAQAIVKKAYTKGYLLRLIDEDRVSVNFDELSTEEDAQYLASLFGAAMPSEDKTIAPCYGPSRCGEFLTQAVFKSAPSETEMMRFLRRLSDKDLSLDRAMIPLGSCTMKLNAAAELMPLSFPFVAQLHPFCPEEDCKGYREMIAQLEEYLCSITGFSDVSMQPNSGAQGEYAGLLAIKAYHKSRGEGHRHICLIPASAHGTNPASAQLAGLDIVVVACSKTGDVDLADLKQKAEEHKENLAALMVTYPSTHGVYEEEIKEICAIIHQNGGQVYFDGANLNALVGLSRPADLGADVCHMNLHKTFAIPHGGGGPGAGPIGVKEHLKAFLPQTDCQKAGDRVSSAPFGSASILVITWMYIRLMGADGLKKATQIAILHANYMAKRLSDAYPVLYTGKSGFVAHEFIIDTRVLKSQFGVKDEDVAKRLIDYGFHAPTMSFPVAGTLMIEPTESEPKSEIDRLCDAFLDILEEAKRIGKAGWTKEDNPLIHAPHTAEDVLTEDWQHAYSREEAVFPNKTMDRASKYWPPVSRIDNVAGDRNLICTCPPVEDYNKK